MFEGWISKKGENSFSLKIDFDIEEKDIVMLYRIVEMFAGLVYLERQCHVFVQLYCNKPSLRNHCTAQVFIHLTLMQDKTDHGILRNVLCENKQQIE